ncbi:bacterio-opsin activator [Natrarchaeobius halalkaliphilus]|uniref:Bacterio-opsin activator n=1 Tax=Natrarchaeobius halalkaliphilus TaxID=1679091 RepID=A0A3N6LSQ8_9EURY|nr:helix-turn-helix domain-containing protein [Natrarchaeobius halalkaliphilus]RQG93003.1 bacterio-opsin activator [Natrarchaeobius halalkaliphilus]
MTGFRATVVVHEPTDCPVASVSAASDDSIGSVNWTRASDGVTVEEFDAPRATALEDATLDVEVTRLRSDGDGGVYRFERERDDCACEVVEGLGTPISSVRAQDGSLLISFRTGDLEEVAVVVEGLRDRFEGVVVEELTRGAAGAGGDRAIVDLDALTPRQREVLETAHEMGYFAYPKGANATEVAEELGVARSTFSEHLAAAQTKLMAAVLDE